MSSRSGRSSNHVTGLPLPFSGVFGPPGGSGDDDDDGGGGSIPKPERPGDGYDDDDDDGSGIGVRLGAWFRKLRRILAQINLFLTGTNPPSVSKYAELVVQVLSAFTLLASIFGWPRLPIVEAIEKWREG